MYDLQAITRREASKLKVPRRAASAFKLAGGVCRIGLIHQAKLAQLTLAAVHHFILLELPTDYNRTDSNDDTQCNGVTSLRKEGKDAKNS